MKDRELYRHLKTLPGFIHNLNSPIMNISGRIELIQFKYPEIKTSAEIIKQIDKINDIIDNLRTILEMGNKTTAELIDLPGFLEMFTKYLKCYLEFKHNLTVNIQNKTSKPVKIVPKNLIAIFNEIFLHTLNCVDGKAIINVMIVKENNVVKTTFIRTGRPFNSKEQNIINEDETSDPGNIETDLQGLALAKALIKESSGAVTIKNDEEGSHYVLEFRQ